MQFVLGNFVMKNKESERGGTDWWRWYRTGLTLAPPSHPPQSAWA